MTDDTSHHLDQHPNVLPEMGSHTTILRPQESAGSEIISLFGVFLVKVDKLLRGLALIFQTTPVQEAWYHRAKLVFRTMSFCLGPGNLWRLPQQSLTYGKGLGVATRWIFGVSLLVFEISVGQYFVKKFAKIFYVTPFMEGITLSMASYGIMANLLYSLVSVYSIMYLISGFYGTMPHSYCSTANKRYGCESEYINYTNSPEYVYFHNYVVHMGMDGEKFNIRNALILLAVWTCVCVIIIFGFLRYHLVAILLSFGIFLTLVVTAVVSLVLDSSHLGLRTMFIPTFDHIRDLSTWIYPAEQTVVSLGVGAGPLTTIWSISKIKYWSLFDCLMVNLVVFVASVLSAMIIFNAAGLVVASRNQTVHDFIGVENVEVHILSSQLFNGLNAGYRNFIMCIYHVMMFSSCCTALLEYAQIVLLYVSSYVSVKREKRIRIIVLVCLLMYLSASIGVCKVGHTITKSINENFIGTALLIIITLELISVSYYYGMHNFCDDIEFMLGFKPNYYYQLAWMILPTLFLIFSIGSLYLKFTSVVTGYDLSILCLTLLLTLAPVVVCGVYKYLTRHLDQTPIIDE